MYFIVMEPTKNSQRFIGQDPSLNAGLLEHDRIQMEPFFRENYDRWLPVSREASILDFGCGYGTFLRYLKEKGFTNLSGVDPDSRCVDAAKKNSKINVDYAIDTKAYLEKHAGTFDLITSFRVVNYFEREEILENFSSLKNALKPNGRLLLEVINSTSLTGSIEFIQDPYLKSQYSDVSLRDILNAAGFELEFISGLKLPRAGLKRFIWLSAQSLWHQILRLIYILERGAIERNPRIFNSHMVVVARRGREVQD